MLIVPAGVKVHLALGYTDMRKGIDGLAMLVQEVKKDPFSGHLFAVRGKKASMLKVLFWDGNGLCLFTKRIDQGRFVWPVTAGYDGSITLTPAQLAMLIEGIDWRAPERVRKPAIAG
ncbi:IS66 family insertion sequence element accessory protein TnpB [Bradyrhizobium sp. ISRA442]|uniref:IS66 family insertion sequence element accessory protein TnpB n=1 Tax=Bradyrhizobium sp. ISRA442 TaxID=2866197 RepID=UPI00311B3D5D